MVNVIVKKGKIIDLKLTSLKQIFDERGAVFHFLRSDSINFKTFGESYFSIVNPSIIKGWKIHTKIYQNFCVPHGAVKFVVFDNRENSPSKGVIQEVVLDNQVNYFLLSMPPGLWYSFKCISKEASIISNIIDMPHTPDESISISLINKEIPYEW